MSRYDDAEAYMRRHFVSIHWRDVTPGKAASCNDGYGVLHDVSAFVISVRDKWFLATAGHIIRQLREARRAGQVLVDFFLNDSWCCREQEACIPVDLDYIFDHCLFGFDETTRFDCGCVYLRPHFRDLLKVNGVEALTERGWRGTWHKYDHYRLYGTPKELTAIDTSCGRPFREVNVTGVSVTAVPESNVPPDMLTDCDRFYGQLAPKVVCHDSGRELNDIEGMSGGPIYGFTRHGNGRLSYAAMAIQSGWHKSKRIIAGFPLEVLGLSIQDHMHELVGE